MKKLTSNTSKHTPLNRRSFLQLASTGVVGSLALPAMGESRSQQAIQLTFAHGPDDSGIIAQVIDQFNAEYAGQIQVTWKVMERESNDYYQQLTSDFNVESGEIDVFSCDVPWTAQFARKKWIAEVSRRFYKDYTPEDFLTSTLNSSYYNYRMWGVPWYTDAGFLYYRKDLLEGGGFASPPRTWDELQRMANSIRKNAEIEHGFVFQGADYEGGVTNALEYIWNAGGRVLTGNISVAASFGQRVIDPNVITVNSADAARGLNAARAMILSGAAPPEVTDLRELESQTLFIEGKAVFLRSWPVVHGLLSDESQSSVDPEQVGVAPLPTLASDGKSYSCQGGWNLMINAFSDEDKQDAAWTFIRFMTAPERQKFMALRGGFLPVYNRLYSDPDLRRSVPAIRDGKDILASARLRPVTPFYQQVAPRISRMFNRVLKGELVGTEAVAILESELRTVLRKNR